MTTYDADFYKNTVFLPSTTFPMRGSLPEQEPETLKKWQEIDIYSKLRAKASNRKPFILHDGPPYANGRIHMGHAFQKSLKDMANRFRQMQGYDTPYVPGWDCHGLPIEWKVEEKYRAAGKDKDDVPILEFREECRQYAAHWVKVQSDDFERMGVCADWAKPYITMDHRAEAVIAREIHKFLMNGSLYKGAKPIMWSVVEKTALAEAEVEYKEHKSVTIWVKFPIKAFTPYFRKNSITPEEENLINNIQNSSVVIWTTTPWTIPSNRALAFGAEIEYGVYEVKSVAEGATAQTGDKLVLATSLAESIKDQAKIEEWTCLDTLSGADLAGTICAHPLAQLDEGYAAFDVPMLEGDFVTDDAGTGFVHIAPGHGEDDFHLGVQNGIEVTDNVTDDGKYRPHVPLFAGEEVYTQKGELGAGNFAVLRELNNAGMLLAKGSMRHDYPHSWRSKAPVIFRTTPQWFISMQTNDLRDKALEQIEKTKWVPETGENRIRSMVEGRPDWCISRQRSWGVPIALFVHKETGEPLKDDAVNQNIFDIFCEEGADSWWARDPQDFMKGTDHSASDYTQVFDVVDVWFESGSTHAFVMEDRDDLSWPADLYLEGSDQHRGWFQSSLLESTGTRGIAPFKTVVTNGFVLDEKGYKMSKSLGNVVDPEELWNKYGADIIRLWTANSEYTEDVRIGNDILKSTGDLYRRIRNTFRFLLGAMDGLTKDELLPADEYKDMPELEQFMLHEMYTLNDKINEWVEEYDFNRIVQALHNFCGQDLSAFYFDIRKDSLYCDRPDSMTRRACRTVLYHLFEALTAWFAPILVYTAEEAWQHRPAGLYEDAESIHLRDFVDMPDSWLSPALAEKWVEIRKIRRVILGAIEPYRKDKTIGSGLEAHPQVYLDRKYNDAIDGQDLSEIAIVSQIDVLFEDAPEDAFTMREVPGVAVVFTRAEGEKCQRCWKILPDVGTDPDFPNLSPRDADTVRWYLDNGLVDAA